jgi:hypothetical protein
LLGEGELKLGASQLGYAPETLTAEFAAAVHDAAAGLTLEQLRAWAIAEESAIAGVALALELVSRLPDRVSASSEWARIGLQHSDRQPSLLGFVYLLEQHLTEQPTLADTFGWLTRRLVIAAHEQIAYSKLPDFTFRFRWEAGRLRFYPIGEGRFGLADMRRESMSRLSQDMGLWEESDAGAVLTGPGEEFVAEVFA